MGVFLLTTGIIAVCIGLMAVGVILKRKPLEKRCSSDPDDVCTCRGEHKDRCENR